ncbi:hypothetical protein V6N13_063845 [Hibiscus sabdariffa]
MFGNGRLESSPVGNSPIASHLDASQSLALMTSKLCYETGKLGFLGLLLSRTMSISVTLSELKSWLYTDDRILITCAGDGQVDMLESWSAVSKLGCWPNIRVTLMDMGLGNKPVPYSPSSACSEANGKAIPQVYKGHGKKRIWIV